MTARTAPKAARRGWKAATRRPSRRPNHHVAAALLRDYVSAVAAALRLDGFVARHIRVGPGPDLAARITLVPTEPTSPGTPATITLAWAEDAGWSMTHSKLRTSPTPWRYLHSRLVPSPAGVAGFVSLVLDDADDIMMLYPAQFGRRGQPLEPLIAELAARVPAAAPAGAPRAAALVAG